MWRSFPVKLNSVQTTCQLGEVENVKKLTTDGRTDRRMTDNNSATEPLAQVHYNREKGGGGYKIKRAKNKILTGAAATISAPKFQWRFGDI